MNLINQNIIRTLEFITEKLTKFDINWILIGSVSLALQGIKINPGDIDILTDKDGIFLFNELFKDYCIKPVSWTEKGIFKSYFGRFQINDVVMEVCSDLEIEGVGTKEDYAKRLKNPIEIIINKFAVKVSPMKDQLNSYKKLGRKKDLERIHLIEEALKVSR